MSARRSLRTAARQRLFPELPLRLRRKIRLDLTEADPRPYAGAPACCGACDRDLTVQGFFADAALPSGIWNFLCTSCFIEAGCPVGYGRGQLYWLQPSSQQWLLLHTGLCGDDGSNEEQHPR